MRISLIMPLGNSNEDSARLPENPGLIMLSGQSDPIINGSAACARTRNMQKRFFVCTTRFLRKLIIPAAVICVGSAIPPSLHAQQGDIPSQQFLELSAKAEQGDPQAQGNLGLCYLQGRGVPKDATQAVGWFRKAAEQGLDWAQYNLGLCSYQGQGVERDVVEAVKWVRKAAEQNYAPAQCNLGASYSTGQGVERDSAESFKWVRKAAHQDLALAQLFLGICYGRGEGTEVDEVEAAKRCRKAAEQDLPEAQFRLGQILEMGKGVKQDRVEAFAWIQLSARRVAGATQLHERLEKLMTPEQVATAQKRSEELRREIDAKPRNIWQRTGMSGNPNSEMPTPDP